MKKLCVFCGSKSGQIPEYENVARQLGQALAQNQIGLVYGGASVGLMGVVADSVLAEGGQVWGVMPKALVDMEVAHKNLTHFEMVTGMHERKQRMYDLADGFVALPGGLGTLDELCEIATWAQLKGHQKPIWVLNCHSFFDLFMAHLKKVHFEGFLSQHDLAIMQEVSSVENLIWDFIHRN